MILGSSVKYLLPNCFDYIEAAILFPRHFLH